MNANKKIITTILLFICTVIVFLKTEVFSESKDTTIKVGLYSYEPYYYRDKNNNITGYYHDLLELLCKDANIEYEYVNMHLDEGIEKLKNNEVDIILGAHNIEELDGIYYSENHISVDNQCIFTKDLNVDYGDVNYLNDKKLVYVKGDRNASWLCKLLKGKNININLVESDSVENSIKMFEDGEVDVISLPFANYSLKKYNKIFKYSSGIVYIIGDENSKNIINKFDKIINEKYNSYYYNDLVNIYNKYFRKEIIIINSIIIPTLFLLILFMTYKNIYPLIKKRMMINKIRKNKEKNNYILYYQPIVDPKKNNIAGFESLLRLKDKNNKILPPSLFIKDIEESDMLSEMTLWILERAINDYKIISNYDCCKDKDFYISINLSSKELENEYFVDKVVQMAKDNNIKSGSIYLEILENICIEDLNKIKSTIEILKGEGFKIALDDFGIEYSNLNRLEMVSFDTIKLDKYFTDNILKSRINNEVINFITNISVITNKNLIIEGVEEKFQVDEIKKLSNENLYIQGYFYSKPLQIEELKNFIIESQ